jgi:hypothetical protein
VDHQRRVTGQGEAVLAQIARRPGTDEQVRHVVRQLPRGFGDHLRRVDGLLRDDPVREWSAVAEDSAGPGVTVVPGLAGAAGRVDRPGGVREDGLPDE